MPARLATIVGFVAAVLLGSAAGEAMTRADGWRPLTAAAMSAGPTAAAMMLIACLAAALALGLLAGLFTNALWAAGVAAAALAAVGLYGGGIDGLARMSDATPAAGYGLLAAELAVGALLWLAGLALVERIAAAARQRLAQAVRPAEQHPLLAWSGGATVYAGLLCAAVGAAVGFVMLRDPSPKQAVGGLIVAFMLGGLAAQTAYPRASAAGVLLSPVLVGLGAYAWMAWHGGTTDQMLADLYTRRLLPLAMAMPLHYVGAGTLGCVLGIAWARALAGEQDTQPATSIVKG